MHRDSGRWEALDAPQLREHLNDLAQALWKQNSALASIAKAAGELRRSPKPAGLPPATVTRNSAPEEVSKAIHSQLRAIMIFDYDNTVLPTTWLNVRFFSFSCCFVFDLREGVDLTNCCSP